MDRRWFPARKCKRDDALGTWPCVGISRRARPRRRQAGRHAVRQDRRSAHRPLGAVAGDGQLRHALFGVRRDGKKLSRHRASSSMRSAAWWSIDRNTVPVAMGDVRITFAGTVEVPGKVVFIHPLHNLAVVSYDPKLDRRRRRCAPRRFVTGPLTAGRRRVGGRAAQRFEDHVAADAGLERRSWCRSRCRARCAFATAIWRPST